MFTLVTDLPVNITTPVIERTKDAVKAVLDNVKELGTSKYRRLLYKGTLLVGFENTAWLGLPSTLIRHENGAFLKRSSTRRNLKMPPPLRFSVDRKHFENETF